MLDEDTQQGEDLVEVEHVLVLMGVEEVAEVVLHDVVDKAWCWLYVRDVSPHCKVLVHTDGYVHQDCSHIWNSSSVS